MFHIVVMPIFLLSLSAFSALADESKGTLHGKLVVEGTGDSQNLFRSFARFFGKLHPGVIIAIPESIGSGGGIRKVVNGEIELARVARRLKEGDKKHGLTYKQFAKSPLVVAVNPSVKAIENLTAREIVGIYSGTITNWAQLGWRDSKIYPIGREPGDSSRSVLRNQLPGFKDIEKTKAKVFYSTSETVRALAAHKNTIGYTPLASIKNAGLKTIKIDGLYPSEENVREGKYRYTVPFGIVYKGDLSPLAKAFVDFIYSPDGQEIIKEYSCVPVDK